MSPLHDCRPVYLGQDNTIHVQIHYTTSNESSISLMGPAPSRQICVLITCACSILAVRNNLFVAFRQLSAALTPLWAKKQNLCVSALQMRLHRDVRSAMTRAAASPHLVYETGLNTRIVLHAKHAPPGTTAGQSLIS